MRNISLKRQKQNVLGDDGFILECEICGKKFNFAKKHEKSTKTIAGAVSERSKASVSE